jgi:glyoxylase-like metal-dependent hydrolase (beta-lactamase superfamily II)
MTDKANEIPGLPTNLHIATVVSVPFDENTYIVWIKGDSRAVVIDPGLQPGEILAVLDDLQLELQAIWLTHGHADHIGGNAALKRRFPDIPILIHPFDEPKLTDPWQNLSAQFGLELISPPADRLINEGEVLEVGGIKWRVAHLPGHCAGHVVFISEGLEPTVVLAGDTLFHGSVGRTDFPDGDPPALLRGIREKLYTLPDSTIILPGHGEMTTVGEEKVSNPYVQA